MTNTQLTHIVAQQRVVELRSVAAEARRARAFDDASEPRRLVRTIRRLRLRCRPATAPATPAVSCD